jgi:hypothetical protein
LDIEIFRAALIFKLLVLDRPNVARETVCTAGYCDQLEPEINGCPFTVAVETVKLDRPVKLPVPPVKDPPVNEPPLTAPETVALDKTVFTDDRLVVRIFVAVKEGVVAEVKTARVSVCTFKAL